MKTIFDVRGFFTIEMETDFEQSLLSTAFRKPVAVFDMHDDGRPFIVVRPCTEDIE